MRPWTYDMAANPEETKAYVCGLSRLRKGAYLLMAGNEDRKMTYETKKLVLKAISERAAAGNQQIMDAYLSIYDSKAEYEDLCKEAPEFLAVLATEEYHRHWESKPSISIRSLTKAEINALLDSLSSHLAGDTSEGDLCWTGHQHNAALRAKDKLLKAI